MPTRPFTVQEVEDARLALALQVCIARWRRRRQRGLDGSGLRATARPRAIEAALLVFAAEPLVRVTRSRIGPERLSLARLARESAAAGGSDEVLTRDIYTRFGIRLADLPRFIEALQLPSGFRLRGGHVFSGEEAHGGFALGVCASHDG
mmetsp:Transcript_113611/g.157130  ORF Transcript_113611/g.157130 Transcript_113611/m.157130 type:complete len:149 (+) Transcript_113611:226-672(+)